MRQRDCRKAYHPRDHVSEGRLLGRGANAGGTAECRAPTARGRAVCGRTACTVLRGEAGNGARSWDRRACKPLRGQRPTYWPPRQPPTLRLCSSPPAYGEIGASKRGVEPPVGRCNPAVRPPQADEAKPAASKEGPAERRDNGEPSLERRGEGQGRGEALGDAAPKNPAV